jgi:hypothetical protein
METLNFEKVMGFLNKECAKRKIQLIDYNLKSWEIVATDAQKAILYTLYDNCKKVVSDELHECKKCKKIMTREETQYGGYSRYGDKSHEREYLEPYCDKCIVTVVYGSNDGFWIPEKEVIW